MCSFQISTSLVDTSQFTQYDPTQEPIFPSELQVRFSVVSPETKRKRKTRRSKGLMKTKLQGLDTNEH